MRRSASGLGLSFCCASAARMNESIGVRAQLDLATVGTSGRVERLKGPPALALETAILEGQPGRPGRASLDPARGWMRLLASRAACPSAASRAGRRAIMSSRTLSSGLPGTTAGPLSPPLNAAAAVLSERFPLCVASPWQ